MNSSKKLIQSESKNKIKENEDMALLTKTQTLLKLSELLNQINQENSSLDEIFAVIRDMVYYKYTTFVDVLDEVVNIPILLMSNFNDYNESLQIEIIHTLESLMYLFIFHFDLQIVNLSYEILNFLLEELDYEYQMETLHKMIKIIYILKAKKTVNFNICNKIMGNISQFIIILLDATNSEVRKCFYEFVYNNAEDSSFIPFLCSNDDFKYSKFFQVDQISNLFEKCIKELEKYSQILEGSINNLKSEKSLSIKNKIKNSFENIGSIAKLVLSFNLDGNKTYSYDKIIKTCLVPSIKKIWHLLLFINDSFFYEIDFSVDSLQNLITLTEVSDSMTFDLQLPLLNWIGLLIEKSSNCKYISILRSVTNSFRSCFSFPEETILDVANVIIQVLEKSLIDVDYSNDPFICYYVLMTIKEIQNLPNIKDFKISDENKNCQIIQSLYNDNNDDNVVNTHVDEFAKEYNDVLLESFVVENTNTNNNINANSFIRPTFNRMTKNTSNLFLNTLKKYEEFKNSLKSLYSLESQNLLIDNKIINFMEREGNKMNNEGLEAFYLESSIEMYREIFNYQYKTKAVQNTNPNDTYFENFLNKNNS